jgi:hypothetical protein
MSQEEPSNKDKKDRCWNCLYWAHITVFVMFTALIAWGVYAFAPSFPHRAEPSAQSVERPLPKESTSKAASIAPAPVPAVLAARDRWSDGEVVSALSSFYQTVITILIAMIGIMGVLAGFTLRALSRSAAEETAHEQAKLAMAYYVQSKKFFQDVAIAVDETAITSQLERIELDVDQMRRLLAKRMGPDEAGNKEDIDGQVEPQVPGPEQL